MDAGGALAACPCRDRGHRCRRGARRSWGTGRVHRGRPCRTWVAAVHRAGGQRRTDDRAAAPRVGGRPRASCRRSGGLRRRGKSCRRARRRGTCCRGLANPAVGGRWSGGTGVRCGAIVGPGAGQSVVSLPEGRSGGSAGGNSRCGTCRRIGIGQQPHRDLRAGAARRDRPLRCGRLSSAVLRCWRARAAIAACRQRISRAGGAHARIAVPTSAAASA